MQTTKHVNRMQIGPYEHGGYIEVKTVGRTWSELLENFNNWALQVNNELKQFRGDPVEDYKKEERRKKQIASEAKKSSK